jgi:hypothetical protein
MGWLQVLLGAIAAILFWRDGSLVLAILAAVACIGSFWSWGVMHNYATEEAKKRSDYSGSFYDITPSEADSVPNWVAGVNILFGLFSLLAFLSSIVYWVS